MTTPFGSSAIFSEPLWYSRGASPYYNQSHEKLRAEVRQYMDTSITPFAEEWEKAGSVPKDVLQRHADLGYTAVSIFPPVDTKYLGGLKLPAGIEPAKWDGFHDLIVIDEIARCGFLGVIWALGCGNAIGTPPLINFGTAAQKQQYLPEVMRGGKRFCLGVTEPAAGSDVANIQTTAERQGDVYIVNGCKKWITNGLWADYCTAAVRTGGPGKGGISALIIPMKTQGVSCRKLENSGVSASGSTFIEFDDVRVPVGNLLGRENHGFEIIMTNFNHERLWLACTSLRLARVCAEDAFAYANIRETFGKKLIDNQTIRGKFATFGKLLHPAQAYMEYIVYLTSQGHAGKRDVHLGGLVALLKVMAGQALETVARESQQIMGGLGYSRSGRGARIEQISRDVRVMVVGGGSEEILLDLAVSQETRAMKMLGGRSML